MLSRSKGTIALDRLIEPFWYSLEFNFLKTDGEFTIWFLRGEDDTSLNATFGVSFSLLGSAADPT